MASSDDGSSVSASSPSQVAQRLWASLTTSDRERLISGLSSALNQNQNKSRKTGRAALTPIQQRLNSLPPPGSSKGTHSQLEDGDVIVLSSGSESDDSESDSGDDDKPGEDPDGEGSTGASDLSGGSDAEEEEEKTSSGSTNEQVESTTEGEGVCSTEVRATSTSESPLTETDNGESNLGDGDSDISDDDDVIILDDDEDDSTGQPPSSRPMICFRCPTKTAGTFRDRAKFLFHLKRHTFGENFSCSICKRPFLRMNLCVAHELRVHGAELDENCYDKNDPLISAAKGYLEGMKQEKVAQPQASTSLASSNSHASSETGKTDGDKDDDVVWLYGDEDLGDGHIVSSTSFLPYRGPPVQNIIECYEIQLNHARPKSHRANHIARIAIEFHERNIEQGYDVNKLGRFSRQNLTARNLPSTSQRKRSPTKRSRTTDESDLERRKQPKQPKKKRARVETILTASSSTSSSPVRPLAPRVPPPAAGDDLEDLFIPVSVPERSPNRKRKRDDEDHNHNTNPTTKQKQPLAPGGGSCLSTLLQRACSQCGYPWRTENDLRLHRDSSHPKVPLVDLLEISGSSSSSSSSKKVTYVDACFGSPPRKRQRKKVEKKLPADESPQGMKLDKKRKLRSKPYRTPAPAPDSSFTEKEIFLYDLGLSNQIRLQLHMKTPMKRLKLPGCTVNLEKMNELEFAYHSSKSLPAPSQVDLFPFHFLLGFG